MEDALTTLSLKLYLAQLHKELVSGGIKSYGEFLVLIPGGFSKIDLIPIDTRLLVLYAC